MKPLLLGGLLVFVTLPSTAQARSFFYQCNAAIAKEKVTFWSNIAEIDTGNSLGEIKRRNAQGFADYLRNRGYRVEGVATCWESGSKDAAEDGESEGKRLARLQGHQNVEVIYDPE